MSGPTAGATSPGVRVPSKAEAAASPRPAPNNATASKRSDIRIAHLLGRPARMGDGAVARRTDLLGIFPKVTGGESVAARLPRRTAALEFVGAQLHVQTAAARIEANDVAVTHERDRAADGGFRTDMADAKAAGRAGKPAVGDERDFAAHALAVQR